MLYETPDNNNELVALDLSSLNECKQSTIPFAAVAHGLSLYNNERLLSLSLIAYFLSLSVSFVNMTYLSPSFMVGLYSAHCPYVTLLLSY